MKHSTQVDQNSNYFRRAKPSLQSSESINRLDYNDNEASSLSRTANQQATSGHHLGRSAQDIYGSKLSTRMQDGARLAWKRSRKFASSVITNGLGGLSACRKHQMSGAKSSTRSNRTPTSAAFHQRHHQSATQFPSHQASSMGSSPSPQPLSSPSSTSQVLECSQLEQRQHTSVVEVGSTVGEYISQHAQVDLVQAASTTKDRQQDADSNNNQKEQQQQEGLIRVDENNKLTIVTKFNDLSAASGLGTQAASSSCSERSRCESSSSGRGTASDSGSGSGSQNGDHTEAAYQMRQQKQQHALSTSQPPNSAFRSHQQPPASLKQHKRRASAALIKGAGSVFSGSQASLNKTFKSFFGTKNLSMQAMQQHRTTSAAQSEPSDGLQTATNETITAQPEFDCDLKSKLTQVEISAFQTHTRRASSIEATTSGELPDVKTQATADEQQKHASEPSSTTTAKILNEFARYEAKETQAPTADVKRDQEADKEACEQENSRDVHKTKQQERDSETKVGFLAQSMEEQQRRQQVVTAASGQQRVALAVEH